MSVDHYQKTRRRGYFKSKEIPDKNECIESDSNSSFIVSLSLSMQCWSISRWKLKLPEIFLIINFFEAWTVFQCFCALIKKKNKWWIAKSMASVWLLNTTKRVPGLALIAFSCFYILFFFLFEIFPAQLLFQLAKMDISHNNKQLYFFFSVYLNIVLRLSISLNSWFRAIWRNALATNWILLQIQKSLRFTRSVECKVPFSCDFLLQIPLLVCVRFLFVRCTTARNFPLLLLSLIIHLKTIPNKIKLLSYVHD